MNIVSLKINGRYVEGLESAAVKITINNISPVTMTGDSVAFSATIKVPKTPENDRTFIGLNKGLLNCEYYLAELQIASIPFNYLEYISETPAEFYAKVSASKTEYTINLIESTDKWSDVNKPISTPPLYLEVTDSPWTISASNLSELIGRYVNFPQNTLPGLSPEYDNGNPVPDATYQLPTFIVQRRDVTWQGDVATGSTRIIPDGYTKGRGGYIYPDVAKMVFDNSTLYAIASMFGDRSDGSPAAVNVEQDDNERLRILVEYTGELPVTQPLYIYLHGSTTGNNMLTLSSTRSVTDRIWEYTAIHAQFFLAYVVKDKYLDIRAEIGGVTRYDYFKFPDGYAPEEVIRMKTGNIQYNANRAPAVQSLSSRPVGFPYSDVKKLVDDLCTAFHWRKIYKNGTLRIEPIIDPNLRGNTSYVEDHIHDWSNRLISVESIDVPDEFADQYVCTLDSTMFSYSAGAGTVTPVKDAYKSGVKFMYDRSVFPRLGATSVFTAPSPSTLQYVYIENFYYSYIRRQFDMFRSRVQVKIKAQLEYGDVENLRLGDAYYFSQLNSCFYIKSLGEYDVATGECKLSLYKLDLNN